ncbi:23081_t:CDS:10 [Entrophospora sp. SA101]|nr:6351_t:CDS:10 [Entrophospora sp. SA101]CAJ0753931.1 20955_t:CDS:10 [Entrophospora sp. SA101]CAJ0754306.1 23081_t:CDS:10 [Entrophospora sp. SA101]CAJ0827984.1 96_t:CDS:10 [Entrophospora sp. SA101]CAJ0890722.1 5990_t:CDS:10 [Entrophospora sp. SA101]
MTSTPQVEKVQNNSAPALRITTKKDTTNTALEESLKTYKLLEALRADDLSNLQIILSTYQSHEVSTPNSVTGNSSNNGTTSPLILAVQCSKISTIEYILSNFPNININQSDQFGNTALHYASKNGRIDVVGLLLKQLKINDTIPNNYGKTPVELAKNQEIIDLFNVNKQEFIEQTTTLFHQYVTDFNYIALQYLFQTPRVVALIDINLQDPSTGTTLLHEVTKKKNLEMVEFCLDHGADVTIRDHKGKMAVDLVKDDKIKNLLKQVKPTPTTLNISTSSNYPPILRGYLNKWTNYAGGYKIRWFVLENGILSYFQNKDDAGNSCRGSINMKIAKVSIDSTDRQRFDIIGKGSIRYHLRANSPKEAMKWITELQQSIEWGKNHYKHGNTDESTATSPTSREISKDDDLRSDSIETDSVPHEDTYHMAISSIRAQLNLQNQLLETLIAMLPKESDVIEVFEKSLQTLQNLLDDVLRMSEERDNYWQRKLKKELETKRLWEESMKALAIEKTEMEEIIQNSLKEQKLRKRQLKAAMASESSMNSPVSPMMSKLSLISKDETDPNHDNNNDKNEDRLIDNNVNISSRTINQTNNLIEQKISYEQRSSLADEYDSDEEFYDAIDGGSIIEGLEPKFQKPYIFESYNGYPKQNRTKFLMDKDNTKPTVSLWTILKNSIGKDLSKITLPVYFNEPTSMLQRMAEDMEYSELLDLAAKQKGSTERILFVAAFAMSNYSSSIGRIAKPFNPLLGETYEYVRHDKAFRYVSEQVSHHPPISACYCESPNYDFYAEVDVKSKFWGKSFEILPQGVSHVKLKVLKEHFPAHVNKSPEDFQAIGNPKAFSEHYSWKKVTTCVNNLIVGKPWIDHYGDMVITNHLTKDQCILTFKARGWRGRDAFEIRGVVKDKDNKEIWEIAGRWNERLVARRIGNNLSFSTSEEDLSSDMAASNAKLIEELLGNSTLLPATQSFTHSSSSNLTISLPTSPILPQRRPIVLLWKKNSEPEEPLPFNLTQFAMTLNDLPESLKVWLAPTDSRLRPDQRAMETGDYEMASSEKHRLEEKQREKRKLREINSMPEFKSRWFAKELDDDTGEEYWKFNHEYWKERERL